MRKKRIIWVAFLTCFLTLKTEASAISPRITQCPFISLYVVPFCKLPREDCCAYQRKYIAVVAGQFGKPISQLQFEWYLAQGKIIKGQGTAEVMVEINAYHSKIVPLIVFIKGLENWHPVCPQYALAEVPECKGRKVSKPIS
ncbi:MAG TPA: hypothetical protein VFZ34_26445 [Blastocatellia bacterium]|nr:hypothetical protein [Blastocatellia bacterium]